MISNNNDNKDGRIQNSVKLSKNSKDSNLLLFKDHIDQCLENQLRKATIIAGYRGGFIYDHSNEKNHEYYLPGFYLNSNYKYSENLLNNLKLSQNYLNGQVLAYTQKINYIPRIDKNYTIKNSDNSISVIYSKSIKEDFNDYIFFNFLKCLNLDYYRNEGFKFKYDNYIAKIYDIRPQDYYLLATNLIGNDGDKVKVEIGNKIFIGNISGNLDSNGLRKIVFDKDSGFNKIETNDDIYNEFVLNLNSKSRINTTFYNDKIETSLYFPLSVEFNNNSIKYSSSRVSLNNRFKTLLDLANLLITKKTANRSIKLDNILVLNNLIKKSTGFNRLDLSGLKFLKTALNDSEEHKIYIYSFIDNDSLILSNPFIFNFGYENFAPKIDLSKLGSSFYEDNQVLLYVSRNKRVVLDLKKITLDKELIDNYGKSLFQEYTFNGNDAYFKITKDGILTFEAYYSKKYDFKIEVDDGEAKREDDFIFISGLDDNTNNLGTYGCFDFENKEVKGYFPIYWPYRNTLFKYKDSSGKEVVYGYSLYLDSSKGYSGKIMNNFWKKSVLKFKKSCLPQKDLFNTYYSIIDEDGTNLKSGNLDSSNLNIIIPKSNKILTINVSIKTKNTNSEAVEPYIVKIYPVSCLGPESFNDKDSLNRYGGDLSCCDMSNLRNETNPENPVALVGPNSNLENHGYAVNTDVYLCYEPTRSNSTYDGNDRFFNFNNNIIWDKLGPHATDLFESHYIASCKGKYPTLILNSDGFYGDLNLGKATKFEDDERIIDLKNGGINIMAKDIKKGGLCNFCYIGKDTRYKLLIYKGLNNFWELEIGLSKDNEGNFENSEFPKVGISTLYKGYHPDDLFILANNSIFKKVEPPKNSPWSVLNSNGIFGAGVDLNTVYIAKKYCEFGNNIPGPRADGGYYKSGKDYKCIDYYINEKKIVKGNAPSSRVCGSYTNYFNVKVSEVDKNGKCKKVSYESKEINLHCISNKGKCETVKQKPKPDCNNYNDYS